MNLKAGTRIEVLGWDMAGTVTHEAARIIRRCKKHGEGVPGYHRVEFIADGAKLQVHETRFRVVDNRN